MVGLNLDPPAGAVAVSVDEKSQPAYTTVMTVMANLHRKGWLDRERRGRAYRYRAARSREEAAAHAVRVLLDSTGDPEGVLLHFVREATDDETKILSRGLRQRKRAK